MRYLWLFSIFAISSAFSYYEEDRNTSEYSDLTDYLSKNHVSITEGHIGALCHREFFKDLFDKNPWIRSIAETGFNAGHSAELFLTANSNIFVTSFDIGIHSYVQNGFAYLNKIYPGRLKLVIGDSKKTVLEYANKNPNVKFDLIFIDGGHDKRTALADILNMRNMAHRDTLLIVDDLWNIKEVSEAWNKAVQFGIIQVIQTYQFPKASSWGLARYNL
jgi:hypothetical protein